MKEEFDRLIYDFLSGSITKEDLHKLNEWIYSDPENQKYFEQQKRIWLLSAEYKNVSVHEEQAYNRFAKRMRKHKSAPAGKMRRALFVKYAGYAAAIIILLFTTPFIIYNFTTPDDSLISEVYAPRKSKLKMKLPDGSIVWLNADSKLSYSESFSRKNRNVQLEGEGYFEVAHGEHPFVVQTDSAQIKVLGTKFNVKNYAANINTVENKGAVPPGIYKPTFSIATAFCQQVTPGVVSTFFPSKRCEAWNFSIFAFAVRIACFKSSATKASASRISSSET